MKANAGDRIVLRSRILVRPIRDGEIIQTLGRGGGPPFLVRWSDEDRLTMIVPGRNAHVLPRPWSRQRPADPRDAVRPE